MIKKAEINALAADWPNSLHVFGEWENSGKTYRFLEFLHADMTACRYYGHIRKYGVADMSDGENHTLTDIECELLHNELDNYLAHL